jgi:hypothetical protein
VPPHVGLVLPRTTWPSVPRPRPARGGGVVLALASGAASQALALAPSSSVDCTGLVSIVGIGAGLLGFSSANTEVPVTPSACRPRKNPPFSSSFAQERSYSPAILGGWMYPPRLGSCARAREASAAAGRAPPWGSMAGSSGEWVLDRLELTAAAQVRQSTGRSEPPRARRRGQARPGRTVRVAGSEGLLRERG